MKLKLGQSKAVLNEERWCSHHRAYCFILIYSTSKRSRAKCALNKRELKSDSFAQYQDKKQKKYFKTRHAPRIEAKNCDFSPENVANGLPFASRSAATQTRRDRLFERLQQHQMSTSMMYQFRKYCRMVRAIRSKNHWHPFERLARAIRSIIIANFSNCTIHWKNTRRYSSKKKIIS